MRVLWPDVQGRRRHRLLGTVHHLGGLLGVSGGDAMSALPTYLMDCETCRHCGTRLTQPEDSDLLEICGECAADLAEAEKRRDL